MASLVMGLMMVGVILPTRSAHCDPDNVATPIAASLGDVTTLGLLAWISSLLYTHMQVGLDIALIIIVVYFSVLPLLLYPSYNNKHTCLVPCTGWTPVLLAMLISSGGGLILNKAVDSFIPLEHHHQNQNAANQAIILVGAK